MTTSDDYEAELRRMAAKMQSKEGKEEYRMRKETVERLFGSIKHNLKFLEFLTRAVSYTHLTLPTTERV